MRYAIFLLLIHQTFGILAQKTSQDTLYTAKELAPVTVLSSRIPQKENQLPVSVSTIGKARLQIGQTKLSLFDALNTVPGVFAMNSENFAQDLRISIRGFGARAAFGIRGLKIVLDGVPESTPDGTAKLGNIDVGLIERIEVLKGATSGIYGNASGGVIALQTESMPNKPYAEISSTFGSYGLKRYQVKFGSSWGAWSVLGSVSRLESVGYRQKSALERNLLNLKIGFRPSDKTQLSLLTTYINSPKAEDPGGITLEEVNKDRTQARKANVDYNTTESFNQLRNALVFDQKLGEKSAINARVFLINRDFNTNQAFEASGQIAFQRVFWGGGFAYQFSTKGYKLRTGLDLENQADNRQRYDNKLSTRTTLRLDQEESFDNTGAYILQEFAPSKALRLVLNTRYDWIKIGVTDNFLSDGNQSAQKTFQRFSPMVGISYSVTPRNTLYGNFTSNFETPSLNELTNNPTGQGGFNPDLNPQKSQNYELGYKAWVGNKTRVDISVFQVNIQGEIVPYQLPNQVGRTFYRNAGESVRKGVEVGLSYQIVAALTTFINYTYSDFVYKSYQTLAGEFAGNRLPGIPKNQVYAELRYFPKSGLFAVAQFRSVSSMYANDANTVSVDGYQTLNLRTGWQKHLKGMTIEPFVGVNNLFDASYFANIQINATANRYYEPAAGRTIYAGIKLGI
ncbi:TonB-dependent receptor [Flectobacillus sp. DC10W]|uniref:TonB-dependent receptor n=1 Tax=Flectobacillus longus TaxID=2984207 RepID=A0ABT6YK03_9BACT|nr:TonB-dependent receptor [Flectobacillus longus]MDI9863754.1 TonB-dependent receptor [Flectobacillus longus]